MNEILPPPVAPIINQTAQKSKFIFGILVGVALTFVFIFSAFIYAFNHDLVEKQNTSVISPFPTVYVQPTQNTSPTTVPQYATINPGQISWLQFPKIVAMNPYLENESGYIKNGATKASDIKYHHVANFADGSKLINAIFPEEGMGTWYYIHRFIQIPDGELYYLTRSSSIPYGSEQTIPNYFKSSVGFSDLIIDGINSPDAFSVPEGAFRKTMFFMNNTISFTELKNPVLMTNTPYGRLYAVYEEVSKNGNLKTPGGIYDRKFWLRLKDDTVKSYLLLPEFLTDDKIPQIIWNDGSKNNQNFSIGFKGKCGEGYGSIIKTSSTTLSSLNPVGKTLSGVDIYAVADPSSLLLEDIYSKLDSSVKPDKNTFLNQKNHFLWKDKFNEWWLFISELNQVQAECGKPVIYLYPPKDTVVNVQVGAKITKSEPLYPAKGWTVLAHPNGQLDYQGSAYPNLFWEGTGFGHYNSHTGEGFVVPQEKLISAINNHLKLLGLNSQESADFMEFWQSKLPTTPYVRLTWLNTADMNQLAPLRVSPSPDTVIRLFLEFEGLDKPISLAPQKLSAPQRSGFTLVEWGGLLRK
ncbi:hypothetical protein KBC75_02035 [Candidatus Shapirobacteria bacterium]|nr:hypothetical protein [Candidatus Shapirobacteria bacterium]